MTDGDRSVSPI